MACVLGDNVACRKIRVTKWANDVVRIELRAPLNSSFTGSRGICGESLESELNQ
jgi:hypothetical protein